MTGPAQPAPVATPIVSFVGTMTLGPVAVDPTTDTVTCALDAANLRGAGAAGQDLQIIIDYSPDGGLTWASDQPGPTMNPYPGVAALVGPIGLGNDGLPRPAFTLEAAPVDRHLGAPSPRFRHIIKSFGTPLNTTATVTVRTRQVA